MADVKAAIFDLDGTLLDAFADIAAAVNEPLTRRGCAPHGVEAIHEWVGNGTGRLVESATPPEFHHEIEEIHREMMAYYQEHSSDLATLYPGTIEVLKHLRQRGITIGVLTNKPHHVAHLTCERMGLIPYLDDVRGQSDAHAPRKPDPQSLRAQIERLGADRSVMIGDGVPDGEVARRAGVPFIACLWGTRNREHLSPYDPVAFAGKPVELMDLIPEVLEKKNPAM